MQAVFYGVSAAVIGIIAIASYKLARKVNGRDPLLWGIFAVCSSSPRWPRRSWRSSSSWPGLLVLLVKAPPQWLRARLPVFGVSPALLAIPALAAGGCCRGSTNVLWEILLFFTKAGAFVFGSGLAIVPFLYEGVVRQFGWLTEQQFLDAVAVAMITPGPVVITVAFIGYLVAGLPGATLAAIGIFLPVWVLTVIPAPWFVRHRNNRATARLLRRRHRGGQRRHRRCRRRARPSRHRRHPDGGDRPGEPGRALALQGPRATARRRGGCDRARPLAGAALRASHELFPAP